MGSTEVNLSADRSHPVVQLPAIAQALWEEAGLKQALTKLLPPIQGLGKPAGLNPNIRMYRYVRGV